MLHRCLIFAVILLTIASWATADPLDSTSWPEARPLGQDFPTWMPPAEAPNDQATRAPAPAPTGDLALKDALALALRHNPALAAFAWEVRVREALSLQAGLRPNPEIEFESENIGGSGSLRAFESAETTLFLSQLIELGGKRAKRRQLAHAESELSGWAYESKRLDVLTDVVQGFVDVLAAQERLSLHEDLVQLAEQTLNTVAERVAAGKVSPVEETRARVALSARRIAVKQARRDLEATRVRLATTWGSQQITFGRVIGDLNIVRPVPPLDRLNLLLGQSPGLAGLAVESERRRAELQLARAGRTPDLTFSGGLRHFNDTRDRAYVFALSFPVPLFDRKQGAVLAAQRAIAQLDLQRDDLQTQLHATLTTTYQDLAALLEQVGTLRSETLRGAQDAFEATREGYRQGKFNYLDVLDAQRTLFEIRLQYIDALAAYHVAAAQLERLIGQSLESLTTHGS